MFKRAGEKVEASLSAIRAAKSLVRHAHATEHGHLDHHAAETVLALASQELEKTTATMDEEAPSWRGALYVSGDDVEDVDFEEEDVYRSLTSVYRSLDMAADQTLPQPALARQRPFAPFLIDDVDEGSN